MSSNLTTLEASYRIVTPMFCAGADQQKAELRLASFKGALRFWWRSTMWGKVNDGADLQQKEAELFGSSDQKIGQSKVRMRLTEVNLQKAKKVKEVWEDGRLLGAHYLAYGVMEAFSSAKKGTKAGELTRPMIPGGNFTVQLRLAPNLSDKQREQVQNALILLGSIGGMGSKSRKGFGSLTLTELKQNEQAVELNADPIERIKSAVGRFPDGQPDWTAWSTKSRLIRAEGDRRAVGLLDEIGQEQVHFRSWGRNGKVLDEDREENFKEDHDLSKSMPVAIKHPKRIAFGLPHNYQTGGVKAGNHDRRASPLFIHIHQANEDKTPVGVVAFLPSLFLPTGEKIKAFKKTVHLDFSSDFWSPIHGYLDRLIGAQGATEKKTDITATEV